MAFYGGLGAYGGSSGYHFPGILALEARWLPRAEGRWSIDLQWNWLPHTIGLPWGSVTLDVNAYAHVRLGAAHRVRPVLAPGLGITANWDGGSSWANPRILLRAGVDIPTPWQRAYHGIFLRPELSFNFTRGYPDSFVAFGAVLEYTLTWRLGQVATETLSSNKGARP